MNQPVFISWKKVARSRSFFVALMALGLGFVSTAHAALHSPALSQKAPPSLSASLFEAAKAGNVDRVVALLGQKVPVDSRDANGGTPLFLAAGSGRVKVIEVLIAAGANPNHMANKGWRPLIVAAQQGQLKAVKTLLRLGANPKFATDGGMTALHAGIKNIEIVKMLLNYGASLRAVDRFGHSVIYTAAAGGNEKVFDYLVKLGENPIDRVPNGYSTLHWAVQNNWVEKVKWMIAKGANVNWRSRDGITPLQLASFENKKVMEAILKKHGATLEGKPDP